MHGSIFCSAGNSGSCNDFRRAGGWRVVRRGNSSRSSRSKVVKVVCLEVFSFSASDFRLGLQSHHGEADEGASCASDGGKARCSPGHSRALSRRLARLFPELRFDPLGSVLWILRSGYRVFHPGGSAGSGRSDEEAVLPGAGGFYHAGKQRKPFRNGPNLGKYERRDAAKLLTVAGMASEGNFADVSSTISSVVWLFEVRAH